MTGKAALRFNGSEKLYRPLGRNNIWVGEFRDCDGACGMRFHDEQRLQSPSGDACCAAFRLAERKQSLHARRIAARL